MSQQTLPSVDQLLPADTAVSSADISALRRKTLASLGHQCAECLVEAHVTAVMSLIEQYSFPEELAKWEESSSSESSDDDRTELVDENLRAHLQAMIARRDDRDLALMYEGNPHQHEQAPAAEQPDANTPVPASQSADLDHRAIRREIATHASILGWEALSAKLVNVDRVLWANETDLPTATPEVTREAAASIDFTHDFGREFSRTEGEIDESFTPQPEVAPRIEGREVESVAGTVVDKGIVHEVADGRPVVEPEERVEHALIAPTTPDERVLDREFGIAAEPEVEVDNLERDSVDAPAANIASAGLEAIAAAASVADSAPARETLANETIANEELASREAPTPVTQEREDAGREIELDHLTLTEPGINGQKIESPEIDQAVAADVPPPVEIIDRYEQDFAERPNTVDIRTPDEIIAAHEAEFEPQAQRVAAASVDRGPELELPEPLVAEFKRLEPMAENALAAVTALPQSVDEPVRVVRTQSAEEVDAHRDSMVERMRIMGAFIQDQRLDTYMLSRGEIQKMEQDGVPPLQTMRGSEQELFRPTAPLSLQKKAEREFRAYAPDGQITKSGALRLLAQQEKEEENRRKRAIRVQLDEPTVRKAKEETAQVSEVEPVVVVKGCAGCSGGMCPGCGTSAVKDTSFGVNDDVVAAAQAKSAEGLNLSFA